MRLVTAAMLCAATTLWFAGCAAGPTTDRSAANQSPTSGPASRPQEGNELSELQAQVKLLELEKAELLQREENLSERLRQVSLANEQFAKELKDLSQAAKDRDYYKARVQRLTADNDKLIKQMEELKRKVEPGSSTQPATSAGQE